MVVVAMGVGGRGRSGRPAASSSKVDSPRAMSTSANSARSRSRALAAALPNGSPRSARFHRSTISTGAGGSKHSSRALEAPKPTFVPNFARLGRSMTKRTRSQISFASTTRARPAAPPSTTKSSAASRSIASLLAPTPLPSVGHVNFSSARVKSSPVKAASEGAAEEDEHSRLRSARRARHSTGAITRCLTGARPALFRDTPRDRRDAR